MSLLPLHLQSVMCVQSCKQVFRHCSDIAHNQQTVSNIEVQQQVLSNCTTNYHYYYYYYYCYYYNHQHHHHHHHHQHHHFMANIQDNLY